MPHFVTSWDVLLIVAAVGYLLGAIPFGLLVSRAFGLGDVRKIGSGNIGATNVLRTGNKTAAVLTLLLDGGKGALAVLIGRWLGAEDAAQVGGLAAFFGHLYPVYLGFRGGKGVATYLGTVLALSPPAGLVSMGVWLLVALVWRYSSLAAIVSAALTPLAVLFLGYSQGLAVTTIFAATIYQRHDANVKRLKDGTEPKIGRRT